MAQTMNLRAQRGAAAGFSTKQRMPAVLPARSALRRGAVQVQAVAAPERTSMKGVQRPDTSGRFGK